MAFSQATRARDLLGHARPLSLLAKKWAIPSSQWLIPAQQGKEWPWQRPALCPSSAGGDSAPARFPTENIGGSLSWLPVLKIR